MGNQPSDDPNTVGGQNNNKLFKFKTKKNLDNYGANREVDDFNMGYESPVNSQPSAYSSPPSSKKKKPYSSSKGYHSSSSNKGYSSKGYSSSNHPKSHYSHSHHGPKSHSSHSSHSSKGYSSSSKKSRSHHHKHRKKSRKQQEPTFDEFDEQDTFDENDMGFRINKKLCVSDFQLLKVVGKGSFGKVMQVRKKDDGKIYAMKVLKKKALVKRKQVVHTKTERRVLARINHPFIVSLRYSFQTPAKLYMILDFFNGGELFFHLKREGRFGESRARFYSGEILLALQCLHNKHIIYRDLKPENILLDHDGHIKITDFGLSKDCLNGDKLTHTFCGTPEYLAPEVLLQQGHGKAVDWWSFGTLLYEMMTGLPPFYDQNLRVMYEKIQFAPVVPPKYFSKNAKTLFFGLLERDPKKRLGSGPRDAYEIREHPFYKPVNFVKLERKEIKPLFKPQVESILDTSNVEDEFTMETPQDTPVIATHSMLDAISAFPGFTYDGDKGATLRGGSRLR